MRLGKRARIGLALLLFGGTGLLFVAPLLAQAQDLDAIELDVDNAGCFGHHSAETPPFRTTVLMVPSPIVEVPAGQEFDFPVQVQVAWKQEMRNLKVALNLSEAPNLAFVGGHDPYAKEYTDTVAYQQEKEYEFPVEVNATEIVVTLAGTEGPLNGNDLDLFVQAPGGNITFNKTIEDTSTEGIRSMAGGRLAVAHEEMRLDQAQILDGGMGSWKAIVHFTDGAPVDDAFTLGIHVNYNTSSSAEVFVPVGRTLPAGAMANVTFHLRALAAGPAVVGLHSLGWAYYKHTDQQAVDNGNFSKVQSFPLTVGTTLRVAKAGAGLIDVSADPLQKLERQWGFLLGWTGFFLVPPSLILGGTFGGGTVRWLNQRVGAARQRVLWHNALSYVLLLIGLTHMTLFLLETTYQWTQGLIFGAGTLAAVIGLGFTGALQNRIAKNYGYATWRFTHFLLGMLVIVFITLHVIVEGVDLQFLRDYFLVG
ncbi:MAG: ferric reductase-like transmembrane domain-containing protein [Halobacteriales archaeon]|nr:ferric reductase-like transmembrane domain-containing protein [Halobacteriales archaeon]